MPVAIADCIWNLAFVVPVELLWLSLRFVFRKKCPSSGGATSLPDDNHTTWVKKVNFLPKLIEEANYPADSLAICSKRGICTKMSRENIELKTVKQECWSPADGLLL